jgi:hypothetical protein
VQRQHVRMHHKDYVGGVMDSFEVKMLALILLTAVLIIGVGLYNEAIWAAKCEQAGGIPSKYHTMVGKTSHSERLCIKKENVVEVVE